ncbi:hypothetical protein HYH03_002634 [Edaphochlamys debaryana]|uniref:Uncharacterized protein n=1 Tax=Edaphochlamys debaryana TaxID=47281 RepID=A0A835YL52_9CHLO|nr:hypothetical protein HYH03_002634 [Edaphochlamys debaryana]|eukprot:KAG2499699.1 hypothetical protein HYH03_002634 [Edaphochlamys debaryana]
MPHYYVVGRDWPDNFYATNAKWPDPAQWTWHDKPGVGLDPFHANRDEMKRARQLEAQEEARQESRKQKRLMFAAIVQRDLDTVRRMAKRLPLLLERRTPFGAGPLGLAAAVGDPALVSFFLAEGCDVAQGDSVGATPLIAAAARGHTQVCQLLLDSKQGGNRGRAYLLRQTSQRGETALHAAAKRGHVDTLAALLAAGADPLAADRGGRDGLMLAAANDHPNAMAHLLQLPGVSPLRADEGGRSALLHAAGGGCLQAVQLLLSLPSPPGPGLEALLGAVDHRGYGPMQYACLGGSVEVIQEVAKHGVGLSPSDPGALDLLRLAARSGHHRVVGWMLKSGIGLQEIVSDGARNPMFAAVRGRGGVGSRRSARVVDTLLEAGARVDPRDSKGRTPLGVAAEAGDTALCAHLVACGASLIAADTQGRVPRRLAYLATQRDTAEALAGMARSRLLLPDDQLSELSGAGGGGEGWADVQYPPDRPKQTKEERWRSQWDAWQSEDRAWRETQAGRDAAKRQVDALLVPEGRGGSTADVWTAEDLAGGGEGGGEGWGGLQPPADGEATAATSPQRHGEAGPGGGGGGLRAQGSQASVGGAGRVAGSGAGGGDARGDAGSTEAFSFAHPAPPRRQGSAQSQGGPPAEEGSLDATPQFGHPLRRPESAQSGPSQGPGPGQARPGPSQAPSREGSSQAPWSQAGRPQSPAQSQPGPSRPQSAQEPSPGFPDEGPAGQWHLQPGQPQAASRPDTAQSRGLSPEPSGGAASFQNLSYPAPPSQYGESARPGTTQSRGLSPEASAGAASFQQPPYNAPPSQYGGSAQGSLQDRGAYDDPHGDLYDEREHTGGHKLQRTLRPATVQSQSLSHAPAPPLDASRPESPALSGEPSGAGPGAPPGPGGLADTHVLMGSYRPGPPPDEFPDEDPVGQWHLATKR